MTIGERIKEKRDANGVTQVALADQIGEKKQTLYKYENNIITNIPIKKIELIATALGTTPAYIMGWGEMKEMPTPVSESRHSSEISALIDQLTPEQQRLVLAQIKGILSNRE